MLSKMGWNAGTGLGRQQQGSVEPVTAKVRPWQAWLRLSLNITPKTQHILELLDINFSAHPVAAQRSSGLGRRQGGIIGTRRTRRKAAQG